MAGKNTAVFGIFKTRVDLESAVDALRLEGFRNSDISVLFPDTQGTKDFAHEKHTKAPEGTAAGAGTGAAIGGVLGWLAGIGSLAIPGIGPFIAAGPIVSALAGIGAGGVVGGLAGALIGMGIPEYEAKRYEGLIHEGGILLSVHSGDAGWTKRAKEILERTGATDISSTSEEAASSTRERDIEIERPSRMDRPRTDIPSTSDVNRPDINRNVRRDPDSPPDRELPNDADLP